VTYAPAQFGVRESILQAEDECPQGSGWFPTREPVTTRRMPCLIAIGWAGRRGPGPMPAGRRPCPARAVATVPIRTCTRVLARSGAAGGGAAGAAATPGWSRPTTPLAPGPARQLTTSWRPEDSARFAEPVCLRRRSRARVSAEICSPAARKPPGQRAARDLDRRACHTSGLSHGTAEPGAERGGDSGMTTPNPAQPAARAEPPPQTQPAPTGAARSGSRLAWLDVLRGLAALCGPQSLRLLRAAAVE
jgi:hypothetical protein